MDIIQWWERAVESSLPFWKAWADVSESQRRIMENYQSPFADELKAFPLAPQNLSQNINPWSFSLIQFTQKMKTSNPAAEYKIVRDVASYGSQLGTIMDFLDVLEKAFASELKKVKDPGDLEAVKKFQLLRLQIQNAKDAAKAGQT